MGSGVGGLGEVTVGRFFMSVFSSVIWSVVLVRSNSSVDMRALLLSRSSSSISASSSMRRSRSGVDVEAPGEGDGFESSSSVIS